MVAPRVLYYDASVAFLVENIFRLLFWQFLYCSHSTSCHCWWWFCIQPESFRSASTASESGGLQSMHLLMPLMDATKMEPMVPGIIVTLLDSTSLDALSSCLTKIIIFHFIIMPHAILLELN